MKIYAQKFAGKTVIILQEVNDGKLKFDDKGYSDPIDDSHEDYVNALASVLDGVIVNTKPITMQEKPESTEEIPAGEEVEVTLTKIEAETPKTRKRK